MEKRKSFLSVKEMVEMALLVALAVVLDLDGFKIIFVSGKIYSTISFWFKPKFFSLIKFSLKLLTEKRN